MCPKPIRAKKARRYGAPCSRHVASFVKFPRFQSKQLVRAKRRNVNSVAHPRRAHSVTKIPPPSRPNPRKTPSANLRASLFAPRSISPRPLPQSEARYRASRMGRLRLQKTKRASPRGETQRMATVKQCAYSASAAGGWPTSVSGATAHGSSHAGSSTATRCARSRLEVPTARVKVPASWRQPGKATSQ